MSKDFRGALQQQLQCISEAGDVFKHCGQNNSPLSQTNPRDALRHAHRVVNKGGRLVW